MYENKNYQIWDQECLVSLSWGEILKNCCHIWYQDCQNGQNAKNYARIKILTFGTKKKPYLRIFKLQLEKAIVIFEISTLKFPSKQIFVQKKRNFKCETKSQIPYLGIFGLQFWKAAVAFGINTPEIVKMRCFVQK